MIKVRVNGEECSFDLSLSVASLLAQRSLNPETVVVEHNGDILPRQQWGSILLKDNDSLEIVSFMCGGA